jgi:hypothetical protein
MLLYINKIAVDYKEKLITKGGLDIYRKIQLSNRGLNYTSYNIFFLARNIFFITI